MHNVLKGTNCDAQTDNMRIGLNLLFIKPGLVGGTQTYTDGLARGLAHVGKDHDFFLFVNKESRDLFGELPGNFEVVPCRVPGRIRPLRLIYEQTLFPRLIKKRGIDILHSLGQTMPRFLSCPGVVTIHDANYWAMAEYFPWFERTFARAFTRQGVRSARRVIAVSEFSRNEMVRWLGTPAEKIDVVHEGYFQHLLGDAVDSAKDGSRLSVYGIARPYILTVASPWPHKNVAGLVAAYARLLDRQGGYDLVVVGRSVENSPEVVRELETIGDRGKVVFTGYVPLEALPVFYRNASVFAFPSLYEGFGLPLLEAMSHDVPVVSSDRASLPEVGGDAALYVDPESPQMFADQILRVLQDEKLREEMVERGRIRLTQFTWDRAARETLDVYQKVVGDI